MVGVSSITYVVQNGFKKLNGWAYRAIFPFGKLLRVKPSLAYLELHLVDHCNMNCKGCGHFSPLADKWFANLEDYTRDMQQLQKLFSQIRVIRLMGGEPLLHPEIEQFLSSTRAFFPKADVRIVTNGLLLDKMSDAFWESCRALSVAIDVTVYPPLQKKEKALIQLAVAKRVKITTQKTTSFHALYNKNGDSDADTNFRRCRSRVNCLPILREGKLYACNVPAFINYFNKRFGANVPSGEFVNIYAPHLTGWDAKTILGKSSSTCCYCTLGWENVPCFPWSTSKQDIAEWDASSLTN